MEYMYMQMTAVQLALQSLVVSRCNIHIHAHLFFFIDISTTIAMTPKESTHSYILSVLPVASVIWSLCLDSGMLK